MRINPKTKSNTAIYKCTLCKFKAQSVNIVHKHVKKNHQLKYDQCDKVFDRKKKKKKQEVR